MPWEDDSDNVPLIILDDVEEELSLLTVENIYADTGLSPQKKAPKRRKPVEPRTTTGETRIAKKKKKTNATGSMAVPEALQPEAQALNPAEMEDLDAGSSEAIDPDDPLYYRQFCNAVGIGMIGFFQISQSLFVAEGWDKRRGCTNVSVPKNQRRSRVSDTYIRDCGIILWWWMAGIHLLCACALR